MNMGKGGTGEASAIVKTESVGEEVRATGGLVSNLPHPQVKKTKQLTTHERHYIFCKRCSQFVRYIDQFCGFGL